MRDRWRNIDAAYGLKLPLDFNTTTSVVRWDAVVRAAKAASRSHAYYPLTASEDDGAGAGGGGGGTAAGENPVRCSASDAAAIDRDASRTFRVFGSVVEVRSRPGRATALIGMRRR